MVGEKREPKKECKRTQPSGISKSRREYVVGHYPGRDFQEAGGLTFSIVAER